MKGLAAALLLLGAACLAGCGGHESVPEEKVFVLGDTTFNAENEEYGVDPRRGYSGWAAVRYGAGETLFRYTDDMELSPWLAVSWERPDDRTWRIRLREGVTFADGRPMDGTAVKESLEAVLAAQPAVRDMLGISSIEAEGLTVTIATAEPKPALLQGLSDPRCCIMDVRADVPEGLAVGTGPYQAASVMPGERLELVRNDHYWGGRPKLDRVVVHTLSDGDTLAMALQSGAVDAAYGLPYASYPLFDNAGYQFSRCATSRVFFLQFNMEGLPGQDSAVRRAAALCIDRAGFVKALLGGHGYPARGPYPTDFSFADTAAPEGRYAPDEAAEILEAAGWRDTDGDGIREKNGRPLVLRWLTYPSRQELPLLAEAAQAAMKRAGIDVEIRCTAAHTTVREDRSQWDIYGSALVTAPTGDPEYFFTACTLAGSPANFGRFYDEALEEKARELSVTFDGARRRALAVEMQRILAESGAYVFCTHLEMNLVSRAGVTGLTAHPCDFYEVTNGLDVEEL